MNDIEQKIMSIVHDAGRPVDINEIVQLLNDTYNIRMVRQSVYRKAESLKRYRFLDKEFNEDLRCFEYSEVIE